MSNIEDRLDRIEQKLDAVLAALKTAGGLARSAGAAGGSPGQEIDPDIDGPRGDPEVRFVPKRWTGVDCKGRNFSACEPEFLDMLADAYEWFAKRDDESNAVDKNGGPKSKWSRLDASRARAWAARLRDGGEGSKATTATPQGRRPSAPSNGRAPEPVDTGYGSSNGDFSAAGDNDDIPF